MKEIRMKKDLAFASDNKLSLTQNEMSDAYARVRPKVRRTQMDLGIG
jgi:hypothetical protein